MQALAAGQIRGRTEDELGMHGRVRESDWVGRRGSLVLTIWVFDRPDHRPAQDGPKVRCKRLQPGLVLGVLLRAALQMQPANLRSGVSGDGGGRHQIKGNYAPFDGRPSYLPTAQLCSL